MNRRTETRRAMLRLARFRELTAMQRFAESLVAQGDAVAARDIEESDYRALSDRYARTRASGGAMSLSLYEAFGALSRRSEARLEGAAARVDEAGRAVAQSRDRLSEASERREAHADRLDRMEARLRADASARERDLTLETWMQAGKTP